jgi:hypothetical protein
MSLCSCMLLLPTHMLMHVHTCIYMCACVYVCVCTYMLSVSLKCIQGPCPLYVSLGWHSMASSMWKGQPSPLTSVQLEIWQGPSYSMFPAELSRQWRVGTGVSFAECDDGKDPRNIHSTLWHPPWAVLVSEGGSVLSGGHLLSRATAQRP